MKQNIQRAFLFFSTALTAYAAHASGYHFGTQSVTAQSTANAAAAEAADATTLFTNPAGLSKLENNEVSVTLNLVKPNVKYSGAEAYYNGGTAVAGSDTGGTIASDLTFAPHLYGAYRVNDKVTLGLGVYVPFGSKTEYGSHAAMRYNLDKTELTSIDIEPAIAYEINEQHSVAAGFIAQYTSASLKKYADWAARNRLAGYTENTGLMDGHADVKGKDWGYGYQLGWLWDINERTRLGVNYRSKIEHNLKGTATWSADGALAQQLFDNTISQPVSAGGNGYAAHEKASLKIVTPESLSVHGMYRATPKWNLFGDVTWTRHSRFNRATLQFEHAKLTVNGNTSDQTVIEPKWRDTYKFAVGASYQYSEPLQLRFGMAYDQSPVRNAESRLTTMPDNDRIWFSFGAKYDINKKHTINAAYSYIYIRPANVNQLAQAANAVSTVDSNVSSNARYKSSAHIFGLQYNYKF